MNDKRLDDQTASESAPDQARGLATRPNRGAGLLAANDFEAERALLCGLILRQESCGDVGTLVVADDFDDYSNAVTFRTLMGMHRQGQHIDLNELAGALPRDIEDLAQVVGVVGRPAGRGTELADLPLIGREFARGGPLGAHPQTINDLYDAHNAAVLRQHSKANPETDAEKDRRLLLSDATRAVSALLYVRSQDPDTDRRRKVTAEALDVAKAALGAAGSEAGDRAPLRAARQVAEGRRAKAELEAAAPATRQQESEEFDAAVKTRLELLARTAPLSLTTKEREAGLTVAEKRRRLRADQQTAVEALRAMGVDYEQARKHLAASLRKIKGEEARQRVRVRVLSRLDALKHAPTTSATSSGGS